MRIHVFLFLLALTITSTLAQAEVQAREITDLLSGFINGLHVERLAPSIGKCINSGSEARKAIESAIHAFLEHQDFYHLVNNVTFGLKTLPVFSRRCAEMPEDVWKHLQEDYFKQFDYSWKKYFNALLLNLGYRLDESVGNALKIKSAIHTRDFEHVGYYSGEILNIVFNVTSQHPVPEPPPVDEIVETPLQNETTLGAAIVKRAPILQANWTEVHLKFREYFNYTMIAFNYTRWVNITTFNNLNSSVANIEMKIYESLSEFGKKVPDVKEAILDLIDINLYLNDLFNGIWFSIKQVPESIFKDNVFQHIEYLHVNAIQHAGYFIYHGYRLVQNAMQKRYWEVARRATIILRKFFYFDADVLEEIYNGIPAKDI